MSAGTNSPTEKLIQKLVMDGALKFAIKAITTAVPFLNLPIINQLFTFVVSKIVGKVYEFLARFVKFTIIDVEEGAKKDAYDVAEDDLRKTLNALPTIPEKREDLDEATKAKIAEFNKRFDELVSMRIAA